MPDKLTDPNPDNVFYTLLVYSVSSEVKVFLVLYLAPGSISSLSPVTTRLKMVIPKIAPVVSIWYQHINKQFCFKRTQISNE